jgi:predicted transcriptional regulator
MTGRRDDRRHEAKPTEPRIACFFERSPAEDAWLNTTSLFLSSERKSRSGRDRVRRPHLDRVQPPPEHVQLAVQGEADRVRAVPSPKVSSPTPGEDGVELPWERAAWADRQLNRRVQVPCSPMAKCDNPMCSCDPCGCASCACGATRLGDLERRVMDILWEQPTREMTGRDVADTLPESAYTTVATVLDRLVHKGLVRRRMDRGAIQFATVGTRAAYTAVLMRDALAADREPESALVRFAETLSPAEAAILRDSLESSQQRSSSH